MSYCGPDGRWSEIDPCLRSCGAAPIVNGADIVNAPYRGSSSYSGVIVNYRCQPGLELVGRTDFVVCSSEGLWSTPYPVCQQRSCGSPRQFQDARMISGPSGGQNIGNRVVYECNQGFFAEKVTNLTSICQNNLQWSPISNCLRTCGPAPTIANAQIASPVAFRQGNSMVGSTVTYQCDPSYNLQGNSIITCQSNGEWTTLPICGLRTCGPPRQFENAEIIFITRNQSVPGDVVNYQCKRLANFEN